MNNALRKAVIIFYARKVTFKSHLTGALYCRNITFMSTCNTISKAVIMLEELTVSMYVISS